MTRARPEVEREAADWVVRLHADQRTRADEQAFQAWLEADPDHARVYAEHAALWAGVEALAEDDEARAILMPSRPRRRAPFLSRVDRRTALVGGLGAVAAAAAIVGPTLFAARETVQRLVTAPGQQRRVRLDDGSSVLLNTDTRLRVQLEAAERRLYLDRGQAFFQVAKDKSRPFRVFVGADEVRALGTAFEVRRIGDRARVVLEEGRVAVFRHAPPTPTAHAPYAAATPLAPPPAQSHDIPIAVLNPGQQLDLAPAAVTPVRTADLRKSEAWRYGRMILDDAPLGDTVADLNRYGGPQIVLADPSLAKIRVSGVFHTGRPEAFVEAVTDAFPVKVERQTPETIVLAPR